MTPVEIPRAIVNGIPTPRLVLGDNGFLKRYGSNLTITEIADRMRYALQLANVGISAGDERVLRAATRADAPWILHHTDIAFLSDGRRVHFGRCMATLHARLLATHPPFVASDPLMGAFISSFKSYRPYEPTMKVVDDPTASARSANTIRRYKPTMTSIGGDYLDALLSLGRIDDAKAAVAPLLEACQHAGSTPVLTTYLVGVTDLHALRAITDDFPALMIPINDLGVAMPPSADLVLSRVHGLAKPVLAMHTLAAGQLSPSAALPTVLGKDQVVAAVVGATSRPHIESLMRAAAGTFKQPEGTCHDQAGS